MGVCPVCEEDIHTGQRTAHRLVDGTAARIHARHLADPADVGYTHESATGARQRRDMHTYEIEFDQKRKKYVAVCTCGWRSESLSRAGMAGAQWDTHKEEEHQ